MPIAAAKKGLLAVSTSDRQAVKPGDTVLIVGPVSSVDPGGDGVKLHAWARRDEIVRDSFKQDRAPLDELMILRENTSTHRRAARRRSRDRINPHVSLRFALDRLVSNFGSGSAERKARKAAQGKQPTRKSTNLNHVLAMWMRSLASWDTLLARKGIAGISQVLFYRLLEKTVLYENSIRSEVASWV